MVGRYWGFFILHTQQLFGNLSTKNERIEKIFGTKFNQFAFLTTTTTTVVGFGMCVNKCLVGFFCVKEMLRKDDDYEGSRNNA